MVPSITICGAFETVFMRVVLPSGNVTRVINPRDL
jgi:hypothetical protein